MTSSLSLSFRDTVHFPHKNGFVATLHSGVEALGSLYGKTYEVLSQEVAGERPLTQLALKSSPSRWKLIAAVIQCTVLLPLTLVAIMAKLLWRLSYTLQVQAPRDPSAAAAAAAAAPRPTSDGPVIDLNAIATPTTPPNPVSSPVAVAAATPRSATSSPTPLSASEIGSTLGASATAAQPAPVAASDLLDPTALTAPISMSSHGSAVSLQAQQGSRASSGATSPHSTQSRSPVQALEGDLQGAGLIGAAAADDRASPTEGLEGSDLQELGSEEMAQFFGQLDQLGVFPFRQGNRGGNLQFASSLYLMPSNAAQTNLASLEQEAAAIIAQIMREVAGERAASEVALDEGTLGAFAATLQAQATGQTLGRRGIEIIEVDGDQPLTEQPAAAAAAAGAVDSDDELEGSTAALETITASDRAFARQLTQRMSALPAMAGVPTRNQLLELPAMAEALPSTGYSGPLSLTAGILPPNVLLAMGFSSAGEAARATSTPLRSSRAMPVIEASHSALALRPSPLADRGLLPSAQHLKLLEAIVAARLQQTDGLASARAPTRTMRAGDEPAASQATAQERAQSPVNAHEASEGACDVQAAPAATAAASVCVTRNSDERVSSDSDSAEQAATPTRRRRSRGGQKKRRQKAAAAARVAAQAASNVLGTLPRQ